MTRRHRQRSPKSQRRFRDPRWQWAKLYWCIQNGPIVVRATSIRQVYLMIWIDQVYLPDPQTGQFTQRHLDSNPQNYYSGRNGYSQFLEDCSPGSKIEWFNSLAAADESIRQPVVPLAGNGKTSKEQLTLIELAPRWRCPQLEGH